MFTETVREYEREIREYEWTERKKEIGKTLSEKKRKKAKGDRRGGGR